MSKFTDRPQDMLATQQPRPSLNRVYPLDIANMRPTRIGNDLATAVEHPRLASAMDG